MNGLLSIPEVSGLVAPQQLVRIPDQKDVPITSRVRRLIDSSAFSRLRGISQLGLVGYVYPGATHSRFEHSLGVYLNALLYLQHLARYSEVEKLIDPGQAECFLVAALMHDVGHWPFCHPMEDLQLDGWPTHESTAAHYLASAELRKLLKTDWGIEPAEVLALLSKKVSTPGQRLLGSMLSGPIDVDKMDYLYRDSLHAGVPYGRQFDASRVIASLCLNESGDGIAITEKGRTAAELMVFARYIMFSEVYWHPAVRSATAMLQRMVFELRHQLNPTHLLACTDEAVRQQFREAAASADVDNLAAGLFGPQRQLYKRVTQFSYCDQPELFGKLSRRPYWQLVQVSEYLARRVTQEIGSVVTDTDILVDAPPPGLEVQFNVNVKMERSQRFRPLGEISPVVQALATKQFDDFVKRVRVFVHPRLRESCGAELIGRLLLEWCET
ncbi:MAG: HD domain-containing protein [Planctomycetaceae bacterium]|nr:HD domain-containing protein [Planctomycetaceae bacterium]